MEMRRTLLVFCRSESMCPSPFLCRCSPLPVPEDPSEGTWTSMENKYDFDRSTQTSTPKWCSVKLNVVFFPLPAGHPVLHTDQNCDLAMESWGRHIENSCGYHANYGTLNTPSKCRNSLITLRPHTDQIYFYYSMWIVHKHKILTTLIEFLLDV